MTEVVAIAIAHHRRTNPQSPFMVLLESFTRKRYLIVGLLSS